MWISLCCYCYSLIKKCFKTRWRCLYYKCVELLRVSHIKKPANLANLRDNLLTGYWKHRLATSRYIPICKISLRNAQFVRSDVEVLRPKMDNGILV